MLAARRKNPLIGSRGVNLAIRKNHLMLFVFNISVLKYFLQLYPLQKYQVVASRGDKSLGSKIRRRQSRSKLLIIGKSDLVIKIQEGIIPLFHSRAVVLICSTCLWCLKVCCHIVGDANINMIKLVSISFQQF